MKLGITSSAELRSCAERAHELRRDYIRQQLRLGMAALYRLIHGSRHAAASAGTGASANPQRGSSMIMRAARADGNSI